MEHEGQENLLFPSDWACLISIIMRGLPILTGVSLLFLLFALADLVLGSLKLYNRGKDSREQ